MILEISSAFWGAFLAFCFFIIGQYWLALLQKGAMAMSYLDTLKEYISTQIYYFETNLQICNLLAGMSPISITLNEFNIFPIEDAVYQRLTGYQVSGSIIKFIVHLRVLNESMRVVNKWLDELSSLSRIAMLEKREDVFQDTMDKNTTELKEKVEKVREHIISAKAKISTLNAEIEFTKRYIRSPFWKKWYILVKMKSSPDYRSKQIAKMEVQLNTSPNGITS